MQRAGAMLSDLRASCSRTRANPHTLLVHEAHREDTRYPAALHANAPPAPPSPTQPPSRPPATPRSAARRALGDHSHPTVDGGERRARTRGFWSSRPQYSSCRRRSRADALARGARDLRRPPRHARRPRGRRHDDRGVVVASAPKGLVSARFVVSRDAPRRVKGHFSYVGVGYF